MIYDASQFVVDDASVDLLSLGLTSFLLVLCPGDTLAVPGVTPVVPGDPYVVPSDPFFTCSHALSMIPKVLACLC